MQDLSFPGTDLMLERLKYIWKHMRDNQIVGRADIRPYEFGAEHFNLNSYDTMRVVLAMHLFPQRIILMIWDFYNEEEEIKKCKLVIEVVGKLI